MNLVTASTRNPQQFKWHYYNFSFFWYLIVRRHGAFNIGKLAVTFTLKAGKLNLPDENGCDSLVK